MTKMGPNFIKLLMGKYYLARSKQITSRNSVKCYSAKARIALQPA